VQRKAVSEPSISTRRYLLSDVRSRKERVMLKVDLELVELQDSTTAGGPIRVAFPFHSASGSASTAAVLFELEPGSMLASHQDSAEEVLHVLEGEAEARIGDERGQLRAGQLAIVPAMVPHSLRNIGEHTLRVLGIFSSSTLVATFEQPLAPDGPQMMVAGAPVPIATALEPVPA
jgi:quercetin dioxygenase-like cupin family protein